MVQNKKRFLFMIPIIVWTIACLLKFIEVNSFMYNVITSTSLIVLIAYFFRKNKK